MNEQATNLNINDVVVAINTKNRMIAMYKITQRINGKSYVLEQPFDQTVFVPIIYLTK